MTIFSVSDEYREPLSHFVTLTLTEIITFQESLINPLLKGEMDATEGSIQRGFTASQTYFCYDKSRQNHFLADRE